MTPAAVMSKGVKCVLRLPARNHLLVYHPQFPNLVLSSHALVSGPTWKRPASDGGLYRGQVVIMCSADCSGSPHLHAVHFIEDLKQATPWCRRFSRVHCRRGRSSPLTPPLGSQMYLCTQEGPADSNSCFQDAASHALVDKSSGVEQSNFCAALL